MRIFIWGINGKMGKVLCHTAAELDDIQIVGGFDADCDLSRNIHNQISSIDCPIDVIIDFSRPSALASLSQFASTHSIPVVLATTGYDQSQQEVIAQLASVVPVFKSGNMSVGVNALLSIVEQAARTLTDFDIEIVEMHHNQKVDAPSGTALMLANAANFDGSKRIVTHREGLRNSNEIGICAVRGGTINGEHSVIFAGADEVITLSHSALSRKIFALGAFKAARLIKDKPSGMYSFKS